MSSAYHSGFLVATILTVVLAIPALLLTNKAKARARAS